MCTDDRHGRVYRAPSLRAAALEGAKQGGSQQEGAGGGGGRASEEAGVGAPSAPVRPARPSTHHTILL